MATTSETIYTHTCDLCGTERGEAELAHLYGKPEFPQRQGDRADVCSGCRTRPVGEVLDFLAGLSKSTGQLRGVSAGTPA